MSVTIISSPTFSHTPVYNGLVYKVSSNQSTQNKFKYISNVYINDVLIDTITNAPAPDGYGYFDVGRIVENYVTFDSDVLNYTLPYKLCTNSYLNGMKIGFAESYGDPKLSFSASATSSTIYPSNGSLDYFDRVDYNESQYLSNTSRKFLTNMPRVSYITLDQVTALTFIRSSTASNAVLKIKGYHNDVTDDFVTMVNLPANSLSNGGRMVRVGIGYEFISNINNTYLNVDSQYSFSDLLTVDLDGVLINRIDVSLISATDSVTPYSSTNRSEIFTFYLKDDVCKYTPKEIWFMNKFGQLESFIFQLANTESAKVNRTTYTNANPLSQLSYSKSDRRQHIMNVDVEKTYSILSNWINEDEARWLEELITSPITFIKENDVLIPINILTDSFDSFNNENKKLFNIKLEYKYTIKNSSQRG